MADSSVRKLNYETKKVNKAKKAKKQEAVIVLNPKSVPWSGFEKMLITIGMMLTLGLMTALVTISISATSVQHQLANIEQVQTKRQNENDNLRQEIGELTSNSRMSKVAKQQGLSLIESNIRKIR